MWHRDPVTSTVTSTAPSGPPPAITPLGYSHVRLTVTDIGRSKAFYRWLFGIEPARDFTDQAGDPTVRDDPQRIYGGCSFRFGDQILGLRPVAPPTDRFDPDRVGLDHVSFAVGSAQDLHDAAARLTAAGVTHGGVVDLPAFGVVILSVQDPDDINLEFAAPRPA